MPFRKLSLISSILLCFFIQISIGQERTSENEPRIKTYFQNFPKSDSNKDGVLSLQELLSHMRKMREGNKNSESEDQFKPAPENTNIRYSEKHKRNVLDYYPAIL